MAGPREIGLALSDLGEVFGGQLGARATELYVEALGDLDADALEVGVRRLIREHERYFPTPGEIRAAAASVLQDLYPALPPPEHQPFPDDPRSLAEIATERRALAPRWAEVRRALAVAADPTSRAAGSRLRPIAEVLAGFVPVPMTISTTAEPAAE